MNRHNAPIRSRQPWIPVVDFHSGADGSAETENSAAIAAVEERLARMPQSLLDEAQFVWIRSKIDEVAYDYLCRRHGFSLPLEQLYGGIIEDEQGRCIEIYWNALENAAPSGWWEKRKIAEPQQISMSERIAIVADDLLMGLAAEYIRRQPADFEEAMQQVDLDIQVGSIEPKQPLTPWSGVATRTNRYFPSVSSLDASNRIAGYFE